MLGQQKYGNQRQELAQEFVIGKNTENSGHTYQLITYQIKGYVDAHLVEVSTSGDFGIIKFVPEINK